MSRRGRQLLRSNALRALAALVAFATLFAFVRGGTRFYYCPITHLTYDAPPCGEEHASTDAPAISRPDCCQVKWRAAAPAAETPAIDRLAVGPAAAVAAPCALLGPIAFSSAKIPFRLVRAGPPPPFAGERRAELMVFHL